MLSKEGAVCKQLTAQKRCEGLYQDETVAKSVGAFEIPPPNGISRCPVVILQSSLIRPYQRYHLREVLTLGWRHRLTSSFNRQIHTVHCFATRRA